jgi:two-component system, cell cycle sensor histidine kinase and response regulator CckA
MIRQSDRKGGRLIMGKGRILVMDDEEIIRDVLSSMLEFLGYEVEFSSDGQDALDKYREAMQGDKRFDAIILDLPSPVVKVAKRLFTISGR